MALRSRASRVTHAGLGVTWRLRLAHLSSQSRWEPSLMCHPKVLLASPRDSHRDGKLKKEPFIRVCVRLNYASEEEASCVAGPAGNASD